MAKKVTIKDVSKELGLSPTTISLVLNGKDSSIPLQTRQRILECVEKLNYHPDPIAQSLATQRTYTIGVLIPDITNSFFTEYVHRVQLYLNNQGYDIFLCNSEDKMSNDIKYINLLKNRRDWAKKLGLYKWICCLPNVPRFFAHPKIIGKSFKTIIKM